MAHSPESFTFTVGKLDAGMAILLGERAHLIEFPSILLPQGATAGSIVNIAVYRNLVEEKRRDQEFWDLQKEIYETFGVDSPKAPDLEVRNVTQTSVTLEWPALHLATAKLRSLDIYRNGERLAAIPQGVHNTSTKLSGLEISTDYTFQLVLRTTAGTFPSNVVRVRTHTMTDTSGIAVCFGTVHDKVFLENAKLALREMRARWSDRIEIDTTHFVCTTPATEGAGANSGPGIEYRRALQLSIPVVQPQWILACHSERKMVPIAQFYLGATSSAPLSSAPFMRPQSMSQVSLQRSPTSSSSRGAASPPGAAANRASMPPPRRHAEPATSTFVNQSPSPSPSPNGAVARVPETDEALPEHAGEDNDNDAGTGAPSSTAAAATTTGAGGSAKRGSQSLSLSPRSPLSAAERRLRNGTMDRNFRFPPPAAEAEAESAPPGSAEQGEGQEGGGGGEGKGEGEGEGKGEGEGEGEGEASTRGAPSSPMTAAPMEVPPPDPVEKESVNERVEPGDGEPDDDIGATEEISLN